MIGRQTPVAVLARDAVPNVALYNLRDSAGWSQQEVADGLNALARKYDKSWSCTAQTVSRWERGVVDRPDPLARRLLAEFFGVSIEELGFVRPRARPRPAGRGQSLPEDVGILELDTAPPGIDPRVERSQDEWRAARRALNGQRHALTSVATRLYEPRHRLGDTGLLTSPAWGLPRPVELGAVELELRPAAAPPDVTGTEGAAAGSLPLASIAQRYHRYSHAIRNVNPMRLFENRLSFRLLDVDWSAAPGGRLTFGHTTYFEMVDVCELLAHETALAHIRPGSDGPSVSQPSWRRLPFRKLITDPFDLSRRPVLPSINTLTIRQSHGGSPSLVLHRRDPASVAVAGGMLHIMPAGVFQPSSILPAAQAADFDLWRNVMREYSEEFLGNPEHDGDGAPIDYDRTEPFRSLERARRSGQLRIYCLGLALDALTLAGEILTVAVIDADVYDDVFADLVAANSEGTVAATSVPFEEHTLRRLLSGRPHALAPAAAGCIDLAWQHRHIVLGR
jgi:transcriptional regulator with XRE-family HTH domain